VYATFDAPDIKQYCEELKNTGAKVMEVKASHRDIFMTEEMYVHVQNILNRWFEK